MIAWSYIAPELPGGFVTGDSDPFLFYIYFFVSWE